jgi:hypothetical protein
MERSLDVAGGDLIHVTATLRELVTGVNGNDADARSSNHAEHECAKTPPCPRTSGNAS